MPAYYIKYMPAYYIPYAKNILEKRVIMVVIFSLTDFYQFYHWSLMAYYQV